MKRLLYLDDSLMALRMMERMLKDSITVLSASSVGQAREILAAEPIDMVVTDYLLDDGNGIDFARRLRAEEKYNTVPILLVSASLTDAVAYLAMKAGINQSFAKPLRPAAIRQAIARQLDSPWIQDVQRSRLHVRCLVWNQGGEYHEYSPDLDRHVHGASQEEVQKDMFGLLDALIGGRMGFEEIGEMTFREYAFDVR